MLAVHTDLDDAIPLDTHTRSADELTGDDVEQHGAVDHEPRHCACLIRIRSTSQGL